MNLLRLLPEGWKEKMRRRAGAVTLRSRLENLRRAGFQPRQIIDAGAFQGDWAGVAQGVFPGASLLLIEPQPQLAPHLQVLCAQNKNLRFRGALLGAHSSQVRFLLSATNSRIVPESHSPPPGEQVVTLPVETLADIARAESFTDCDCLKLDLQGHELEALAGAGDLFGRIEVIITEVSWLPIGNVPLVSAVIAAFGERGYRPYDIWGFNYRPLDGALWQADLAFVRADSPLLANRNWS